MLILKYKAGSTFGITAQFVSLQTFHIVQRKYQLIIAQYLYLYGIWSTVFCGRLKHKEFITSEFGSWIWELVLNCGLN